MAQPVYVPVVRCREHTGTTALKAWSHFPGRSENLCTQNPHMFVTAPVLEALPVVAEQIQPTPVVEYVTPARTVTCAAPVTTVTVTSTVFPTATVLLANCAEARGDPTGADLGQIVDLPVVVVRRQVPMVLAVHRLVWWSWTL